LEHAAAISNCCCYWPVHTQSRLQFSATIAFNVPCQLIGQVQPQLQHEQQQQQQDLPNVSAGQDGVSAFLAGRSASSSGGGGGGEGTSSRHAEAAAGVFLELPLFCKRGGTGPKQQQQQPQQCYQQQQQRESQLLKLAQHHVHSQVLQEQLQQRTGSVSLQSSGSSTSSRTQLPLSVHQLRQGSTHSSVSVSNGLQQQQQQQAGALTMQGHRTAAQDGRVSNKRRQGGQSPLTEDSPL